MAFGSGSKMVSNVYHIIWRAMYTLAADPHPRIAKAAERVVDEIRSRSFSVMSSESLKESKSNSSISESSSPNTEGTFSIGESPPSYSANHRSNGGDTSGTASTILTTATANSSASNVDYLNRHNNNNHLKPNAHFDDESVETDQSRNPIATAHNTTNVLRRNFTEHQDYHLKHQASLFSSGARSAPIDRVTKSAHVAITKPRRYAPSRDNNVSEDEVKSNLSSHKPLVTTDFVDWCTRYFIDPENNLVNRDKDDEKKEWRMLKIMSCRKVCLRDLMCADPSRFNENQSSFKITQVPNLIAVHPYDPIMIVAGRDEFSILRVNSAHNKSNNQNQNQHEISAISTNITTSTLGSNSLSLLSGHINGGHHTHHNHVDSHNSNDLICTQSNCHSSSSQITSLQLINPQYNTLICTGTSEGSVRIWRVHDDDCDYNIKPQLVTAFQMMPDHQPSNYRHTAQSGMILLWNQMQARFYATSDQNDMRIIKVWDASSESKIQDIPTCAEYGVSCLASDGEHSIAAGFLDGSIRIYDTRLRKTDCRTFTFRKHSDKISSLHMFKPGEKHINLVSGDLSGEVRFWDKRAPTSVKRVDIGQKMNVMSVHPNADIFACGLKSGHGIKLYNLDGASRAGCVLKCQDNTFFASRHNPSVNCIAFHPLKPSLVAGFTDSVISIYSSRNIS